MTRPHATVSTAAESTPRAILLASYSRAHEVDQVSYELDELRELVATLKIEVVDSDVLRLREIHPGTYYGQGIVSAMAARAHDAGATTIICNDELSPRQQKNLAEEWDLSVMDRTEVILEIFASRAQSSEGRLQVEMAQMEHMLPRLAGGWTHLERQRGGIGLRGGAGESQIEVDRRLIRSRMKKLKERLAIIKQRRETQRRARQTVQLASCALVGYTNAGKSTLLNKLTKSDVYADDRLFATLDPTSRVFYLPMGERIVLTDTVGFLQRLPHELVDAFGATLEETKEASMLGIVVDISHPQATSHLETVLSTLEGMECTQPAILILSKIDLVDDEQKALLVDELGRIAGCLPLMISSTTGEGVKDLGAALGRLAKAAKEGDTIDDAAISRRLPSAI